MIWFITCKLCGKKFRENGESVGSNVMYNHLRLKHKKEFKKRENDWKQIRKLEKQVNYDNWFTVD